MVNEMGIAAVDLKYFLVYGAVAKVCFCKKCEAGCNRVGAGAEGGVYWTLVEEV